MNTNTAVICIVCLVCFLTKACTPPQKCSNCGVALNTIKVFDKSTRQYVEKPFFHDLRIWYKDSLIIEEIKHSNRNTDPYGNTSFATVISHYTFVDLRNRSFYDYRNFSDTAKIMKMYTQPDSINIDGGWNFYAPHDRHLLQPPFFASDTVIKNVVYKQLKVRILGFNNEPVSDTTQIAYLRCDKKGTILQYNKSLSEKLGCPIVRFDILPTDQNPFPISSELEFLADELTKEELKVFAAWERNAKLNPVKK